MTARKFVLPPGQVRRADVGACHILEPVPDATVQRVEIGRGTGQRFEFQASSRWFLQERLDDLAAMDGRPSPDDQHRTGHHAQEVAQALRHAHSVKGACLHLAVELTRRA